jgi:hypothetical protein
LLCALLLVALAGLPTASAAAPVAHLNGAGLVIQHGDGRVLYFYIQFKEPQITGEQLLERSGVSLDVTPYSGLGEGICLIDGEGCPSTNCFCKSYAVPSVYWRYHTLNSSGQWVFRSTGPDQRMVHDGDVDGWSWSSTDGKLPATSIDQIAKLNGVDRVQVKPIATPNASTPVTTAAIATPTLISPPAASNVTVTATPSVLGVEVSDTGQKSQIVANVDHSGRSWRDYVGFVAGVVVLLALGLVAFLRRRGWAKS